MSEKRTSDVLLDITESMIDVVCQELEIFGLSPDAISVVRGHIVDIWEVGGDHALSVLRELQLDSASKV
jgi:hypothetical protein